MSVDRRRNLATVLAISAIAATLIAWPLTQGNGVPALQQDWLWPGARAQCFAYAFQGMTPWLFNGVGSPAIYPQAWAPYLSGGALCFVVGPHWSAPCFVWLESFVAALSMAALLRTLGVRQIFWCALGAAMYVGSPVILNELQAGHLFFLWSYALLPLVGMAALRGVGTLGMLFAGAAIAICGAQQQFLVFAVLLFVTLVLVRKREGRFAFATGAIAIAIVGSSSQWILVASHGAASFASQRPLGHWEESQSAFFADAIRFTGYIGGYDVQLPYFCGMALFLLAPLTIVGAIVERRNTALLALGVGASISVMLYWGLRGPLAVPIEIIFDRVSAAGIFRELYNFGGLAFCCSIPVIIALLERARARSAILAYLVAAILGINALVIGALATKGIPSYAFGPSELSFLQRVQSSKEPVRFVTVPAILPQITSAGQQHGGLSPWAIATGNAASTQTPQAGFPLVALARAAMTPNDTTSRRILDRGGISEVLTLPGLSTKLDLEPRLHRLQPTLLQPSKVFTEHRVAGSAGIFSVEPFSSGPATIASAYQGVRDIGPLQSSAATPLFDSTGFDPSTNWIPQSLMPIFPDWAYELPAGIVTASASPRTPNDFPATLVVGASSQAKSTSCVPRQRISSHFWVLQCQRRSVLTGLPPFVISQMALAPNALIQTAPLAGRYGSVSVDAYRPWMADLEVVIPAGSALTMRSAYDSGWQCSGCNARHAEVDGYANAWIFPQEYRGHVRLFFKPAIAYFGALSASIGIFWLGVAALIAAYFRRSTEMNGLEPITS